LCTRRDGEAADQCPATTRPSEVCGRLT
jgi:hypothetical protein